jgi:ferredoxin like protein
MEYIDMNLDQKLYTLKYTPDNESHLNPDQSKCKNCVSRNCTYICPAGVYEWNEEKQELINSGLINNASNHKTVVAF